MQYNAIKTACHSTRTPCSTGASAGRCGVAARWLRTRASLHSAAPRPSSSSRSQAHQGISTHPYRSTQCSASSGSHNAEAPQGDGNAGGGDGKPPPRSKRGPGDDNPEGGAPDERQSKDAPGPQGQMSSSGQGSAVEKPPMWTAYPTWLKYWVWITALVYLVARTRWRAEREEKRKQMEREAALEQERGEEWERFVSTFASSRRAQSAPAQAPAVSGRHDSR